MNESRNPVLAPRRRQRIGNFLVMIFFIAAATGRVSADLNGDGSLDAVLAVFSDPNRVCIGNGSGGFTCSNVNEEHRLSTDVGLGDFNGDGHVDAVFSNQDQENQVCFGNGAGALNCDDLSSDTRNSQGLDLGQVNGDGNIDVVFANRFQSNRLCLGDGAGAFTCSSMSADTRESFDVELGDLNGDDDLDAVFANINARNRVCLGDGSGAFVCSDVSSHVRNSFGVSMGDVNGDEKLDAVFANQIHNDQVCLGNGSGGFTCADVSADTGTNIAVELGDFNGDGKLDAVYVGLSYDDQVCLGDGTGDFACSDLSAEDRNGRDVALGRVNGDIHLDAVFANTGGPNLVCLGNGAGGFACSDFNSDGLQKVGIALSPAITSMSLTKSTTVQVIATAGQVVPFYYLIRNTGERTLHDVLLTDDNVDEPPVCLFVGNDELTPPPDSASIVVCTAQRTITPGEIEDEGMLVNTATADSDETVPINASLALPIGIYGDGFEADCPCWTAGDLAQLPTGDNTVVCEFQDDGTFGLILEESLSCEHDFHTGINPVDTTCTVNRFDCPGLPDRGIDLHGISDRQYFACLDLITRRCDQLSQDSQ